MAFPIAFITSPAYGTHPIAVKTSVTHIIISCVLFCLINLSKHASISLASRTCPTNGIKFNPISINIDAPLGSSLNSPCKAPQNDSQKLSLSSSMAVINNNSFTSKLKFLFNS